MFHLASCRRSRVTRTILVVCAAGIGSIAAEAASMSYSYTLMSVDPEGASHFTVDKFDSDLGTLTAVSIDQGTVYSPAGTTVTASETNNGIKVTFSHSVFL